MKMSSSMMPIKGCWVSKKDNVTRIGQVVGHGQAQTLFVQWFSDGRLLESQEKIEELCVGFQPGWEVEHGASMAAKGLLGSGMVNATRRIANHDQVLVQLYSNGKSVWLPYESLARIKPTHELFANHSSPIKNESQAGLVRLFAILLGAWDISTGALGRFDIDPLPHQLQLVHRILSSGSLNWLIADDVGLGKTIEVGLLLAALNKKDKARRVLIVCPASLTRQWQDELQYKFDEQYEIYGSDFSVPNPKHWPMHERVIASIDFLKREEEVSKILQSPVWDIVVVDEAHKLTKQEDGSRSQRYELVQRLRDSTRAVVFLTATPHQGKEAMFLSLLELLRPDLSEQIGRLSIDPELVAQLIVRNRKLDVVDSEGNFIFRGHETHKISIELSEEARVFQDKLSDYLENGYNAASDGTPQSRAIGFVMTIFRKLASSSIAAVESALSKRLTLLFERGLDNSGQGLPETASDKDDYDADSLDDEIAKAAGGKEFFSGEIEHLQEVLSIARLAKKTDRKLAEFMEKVVGSVMRRGENLLIFTEYRATQAYLVNAIASQFPEVKILQIHGSLSLDEKIDNIKHFNQPEGEHPSIMISTEAGGEGLNLHESCYILVNYDLPWNPSRLVQRIGRLYRYGQKNKVIVFNILSPETLDSQMLTLLYDKIGTIARQMACVNSSDYQSEQLEAEILGKMLDHIDVSALLERNGSAKDIRTEREIDEAIRRAKEAMELQDDYLKYAGGFDEKDLASIKGIGNSHLKRFLQLILPMIGANIRGYTHDGDVIETSLPDSLVGSFPEYGGRQVLKLTSNRRLAQKYSSLDLVDSETSLLKYLLERARANDFGGHVASFVSPQEMPLGGHVFVFRMRYQDILGFPNVDELFILGRTADGMFIENPDFFCGWALSAEVAEGTDLDIGEKRMIVREACQWADKYFEQRCTRLKHPSQLTLLFVANLTLSRRN